MVEDLGLASLGVGNEGLIQHIEDVLADFLQLVLDLVAVLADGANVLIRALGLLLLLNRGDDAPAGAAGADDVLVGNGEQVALVDGKLAAKLGHLLHVRDHLIVTLGLLAKAGEESLAAIFQPMSVRYDSNSQVQICRILRFAGDGIRLHTSHAVASDDMLANMIPFIEGGQRLERAFVGKGPGIGSRSLPQTSPFWRCFPLC